MKNLLIILFLFSVITKTLGQDKALTSDSDTVFWYSTYQDIWNEIGLEQAKVIKNDFYFRFWDGTKAIEIRKEDKLKGTVTFLVQQYKRNKEGRIYFKQYELSDTLTKAIYQLVLKNNILELPTDKQIKGWEMGLDGITYIIEHSDKNSYSFKNYWTPNSYKDKIKEAKVLTDFINELNDKKELVVFGEKFMRKQPFNSWYNFIGSATIVTKVN